MAGGLPPNIPPPSVPGLTGGPPTPVTPPDQVGSVLNGLKNRRGSATELMKQVVTMLETVASLDPSMENRAGAALALLRGPKRPGDRPDGGND
jgi:hypothetical protein